MVVADDGDGTGVAGPVPAAAFAVVVGCVRIQAGAAVARVAFARLFGFGGFLSFRFLPGFGLPLRPFPGRNSPRSPPGGFAQFPGFGASASNTGLLSFHCPFCLLRSLLPGFAFPIGGAVTRAAAHDTEEDGETRGDQGPNPNRFPFEPHAFLTAQHMRGTREAQPKAANLIR